MANHFAADSPESRENNNNINKDIAAPSEAAAGDDQIELGTVAAAQSKNCYVEFEHTDFSVQNKKAMALLIMLLNRKNSILKHLRKISSDRKGLILEQ